MAGYFEPRPDDPNRPVLPGTGLTPEQLAAAAIPLPAPDPTTPVAPAPIVSPVTGAPYQAPPSLPSPIPSGIAPPGVSGASAPATADSGAPDGLPLTKAQQSTTVTRERETAAEKQLQKDLAANDEQARKNLEARQQLDNLVAESTRTAQAEDAARRKAALDAHDAELSKLKGVADAEESRYKQQLADFRNPRNGYFADLSTGEKIFAGISLVLGLVGGLTDGSNVGAERIIKAVDADTAKRRMLLEAQERIVNRAKGDVGEARANLAHQKDMLDLRAAVGLEAAIAQARGRAQMLGISEDNLRNNEQLQKLEREALERRAKHEEGLRTKASTTSLLIEGGLSGRGGAAGTETDKKFALMGKGILDDLTVVGEGAALTPQMLDQWQRSSTMFDASGRAIEKGVVGAAGVSVGRAVGLLPRTKYEGLSAQQQVAANALDSAGEKLFRIYTGAGMPETEARRMVTQQLPHAGDSPEVVRTKIARLRADAERMSALGGRATSTIAGIERAPTPTTPAAAPAGKRVRLKDGRTGTLYPDGNFQAD